MERVKGLDAEDLSKTFRPKNVLSEKTCDLCSNLISNLGLVPLWDSYLRDKQDSVLLEFAAHPTDTRAVRSSFSTNVTVFPQSLFCVTPNFTAKSD